MPNKTYHLLIVLAITMFCHGSLAGVKIEQWTTEQGTRVYYVNSPGLPMVDIQVAFDAGGARDGTQYGIASLTSSLLDTGAGDWNADQIAQRFEILGSKFGSSVSDDMATFYLRSLTQPELFDKVLETVNVILTDPRFRKGDFEREKKRTLAGLKYREESPGDLGEIAFYQAMYGEHPYGHPGDGFMKTISALTPDDLKAFYKRYYTANNAVIAIVGDLDKNQAEQVAKKLIKNLPKGQVPVAPERVKLPSKAKVQRIFFPSEQTHVFSGLPVMDRKDKDYFPLAVGNFILGGSGLVSKLFQEVREKRGLAYSASSNLMPLLRKGPFIISFQSRNDQAENALNVVNETVKKFITSGPTEAELNSAIKNITGGFAMRFDSNKELSQYVTMIGFYQLPLTYLDDYPEQVKLVTREAVRDAFKRRILPNSIQTVLIGRVSDQGREKK